MTTTTALALVVALAAAPTDAVWNVLATTGTPVHSTTSPADAPRLGVGQYVDDIPVAPETRYYRVTRSSGATLDVSFASRPAEPGTSDHNESWDTSLETLSGSTCDSQSMSRSTSYGTNPLVTGVLETRGTSGSCGDVTDLVLKVKRKRGSETPARTEIRVIETPAVANIDSLPAPDSAMPPALRPPVAADAHDIAGGSGFENAAQLGTGTYVTHALPGQLLFFKTHLDEGQRVTYAIDGPTPAFTAWPNDSTSMTIATDVYNPLRDALGGHTTGSYSKISLADDQVAAIAPVKYRNRQASNSDIRFSRLAGDYYYTIVVGRDGHTKNLTTSVPVKFSIRVEGTATTAPQWVKGIVPTASNSPRPTSFETAPPPDAGATAGVVSAPAAAGQNPSTPASSGPSAGIWIGLGLAGVAALGLLAYAITRRLTRRPSQ